MTTPIHISPLEPLTFTMRDASLARMGEGRAPGIHLSEIVRAMKEAIGEKTTGIAGEDENVRPQEGFWWEMAMEHAFKLFMPAEKPEIIWQVKLQHEQIHATPDGYDPQEHVLISAKHTARSMKKWKEDTEAVNAGLDPEHFWPWLVHDMGCLYMLNHGFAEAFTLLGHPVFSMRYFIHWSHGDWSRDFKANTGRPQPTTCLVTFHPEKLEENWKTILRYRDYLLAKRVAASSESQNV